MNSHSSCEQGDPGMGQCGYCSQRLVAVRGGSDLGAKRGHGCLLHQRHFMGCTEEPSSTHRVSCLLHILNCLNSVLS